MHQERKWRPTLRVIRRYEPDRMAPVNLQVAYEKVVPTEQYRILFLKQEPKKTDRILPIVEEVCG
jgi:hypothetical protein